MSLRPLAISLVSVLVLSGGLALGALATGQALGEGTEDLAAGLANVAAARAAEPELREQRLTPAATPHQPRTAAPKASRPRKESSARAEVKAAPAPARTDNRDAKPAKPAPGAVPRLTAAVLTARADAPTCDDVYVYIVSTFEDSVDSVATLSLDAKRRGRQRRIGQRLGPYEVIAIGYNRSRFSSAVWLAKGKQVCQALVQDPNPVREKAQRAELAREHALQKAKQRNERAKQRKNKKQRRRGRR